MEERVRTALEFLKDGQSFTVGELRLGAEKLGVLEVTGWSQYTNFANLTKRQCLRELEEIKARFYGMVNVSSELNDFVKDKLIEFNLCFDDYGKGSIWICSEKNGIIKWEADFN